MTDKFKIVAVLTITYILLPNKASAMHIMDGMLPPVWCISWGTLAIPFIIFGMNSISKTVKANPRLKMLLGLTGAFAFVISAIKLPSVTGSSSHATGVGLGAILFGPAAMSVIGSIVLIFQAMLLAHGGITTLGANIFSMAIAGPLAAAGIYRLVRKAGGGLSTAVFCAAFAGDLVTYCVTSLQLALAFPSATGGIAASFLKFLGVYALTQLPLAVCEGIVTVLVFNALSVYGRGELTELSVIPGKDAV